MLCASASPLSTYQGSLVSREANPELLLPAYIRSTSPDQRNEIRKLEEELLKKNDERDTLRKKVFDLQAAYNAADKKFGETKKALSSHEKCLEEREKIFRDCRTIKFYNANKESCDRIKECDFRSTLAKEFRLISGERNEAATALRTAIDQLEEVRSAITQQEEELQRLMGGVQPQPSVVPRAQ